MNVIQHYERIAAVIDGWHPSDLAFIKSIHITPQEDLRRADLLIHFFSQSRDRKKGGWPDSTFPFFEIGLMFHEVSDLKLEFGGGILQVTGFDIEDIRERGWEGINFSIEDYENGRISFYCREIAVMSVSNSMNLMI